MTVTHPELRTGTVGEAMTPGILTCLPVTPLRVVARMMVRHRVHAIVVFGADDNLHPWGVVSDLDLIGAIGAGSGVDLATACGSAQAVQAQLKRVVDLGIRSLDLSVPAKTAAVWAKAVKALQAQYPDLTVAYTLASGAVDSITRPLAIAEQYGAVVDRVNVLPADLTSSALDRVRLSDTVATLMATAEGVHDRLMAIQGLDAATAWQHLGIVPILGADDRQGGPAVQNGIDELTGFVKSKGVGMLGFLPIGADRQCSGLLALTCLDANILPQVLALTDLFNDALA